MEPILLVRRGAIPEGLGANARGHHMALAKHKKGWRWEWFIEAGKWMDDRGVHEPFERVEIQTRAYFCRSKSRSPEAQWARHQTQRPKDEDNLQSCMKSAIDGLVDAGLVPDDTAKHVKILSPVLEEVETFAEERVELVIEPVTAEHE